MREVEKWILVGLAVLYNPLVPVELGNKTLWTIVNVATVVYFWVLSKRATSAPIWYSAFVFGRQARGYRSTLLASACWTYRCTSAGSRNRRFCSVSAAFFTAATYPSWVL